MCPGHMFILASQTHVKYVLVKSPSYFSYRTWHLRRNFAPSFEHRHGLGVDFGGTQPTNRGHSLLGYNGIDMDRI